MAGSKATSKPALFVALIVVGGLVAGGVLLGLALGDDDSPAGAEEGQGGEPAAEAAPLTDFEEALIGGWSRFHSYDGIREYLIFTADRSACHWEKDSSGSVIEKESYAHWELLPDPSDDTLFAIYWGNPGDLWTIHVFRYTEDQVMIGGQSDLDMDRDPELVECFS